MIGEATLFTRSDEVEAAWRVVDPLIKYWESHKPKRMPTYAAGSWGPREADELIEEDRRSGESRSPFVGLPLALPFEVDEALFRIGADAA